MNEHEKILKLYSLSLDGGISAGKQAEIEAHTDSCQQCRENMELLRKTWDALSVLAAHEPSADFEAKLREKIYSHSRDESPWEKAVRLAPAMGMAIWIAGLVTGGLFFMKESEPAALNDPLTIVLGNTLPDNSIEKIYLEAGENI